MDRNDEAMRPVREAGGGEEGGFRTGSALPPGVCATDRLYRGQLHKPPTRTRTHPLNRAVHTAPEETERDARFARAPPYPLGGMFLLTQNTLSGSQRSL